MTPTDAPPKRTPVPRGLARTGPVILSYGFRPFFLAAGLWAVAAMAIWVGALIAGWAVGGTYGGANWHAHEMLFGYSSAALAGFLLTAVPNWTGRLPVSGLRLAGLFSFWLAGRLALLVPDLISLPVAIAIDMAFLPLLLAICLREVIAGRKWKDLKVMAVVTALALANGGFHALIVFGNDAAFANRLAVAAYAMLIGIIGGRVVPSFTRNWLAKRHIAALPAPYDRFDTAALITTAIALAAWTILPASGLTVALTGGAALLNGWRLWRWRGWRTGAEPLVLVLHVAYGFVPLGLGAVALAAAGLLDAAAALHVLTVGAIGTMTLAIMTRATRGHTGSPLVSSPMTNASYVCIVLAALARLGTGLWPELTMELLSIAGGLWIGGFTLYVIEHAPLLLRQRRDRPEGAQRAN
ncbi:MAG: NnrS family protein [Devosia sp.]|nr:NnrS family protein [Devosia sp.]